jgi:hypothetical protein
MGLNSANVTTLSENGSSDGFGTEVKFDLPSGDAVDSKRKVYKKDACLYVETTHPKSIVLMMISTITDGH